MGIIEVVIRLSEDDYKYLKEFEWAVRDIEKGQGTHKILGAILNGIVLPKKHGRLIDADSMKRIDAIQRGDFNSIESIRAWIDIMPTIIEAER